MNKELANRIVESIKNRIIKEIKNADKVQIKKMTEAMKRQRKNITLFELRNFYVRKVTKHSIGDGNYIVRINNFMEINENMELYRISTPKIKLDLTSCDLGYISNDFYVVANALIDDDVI